LISHPEIFFNIDFYTVGFVLILISSITLIVWKPHLIIYFLIIITMFPRYFSNPIQIGYTNVYYSDLLLLFYCVIAGCIVFIRILKKEAILSVQDNHKIIFGLVLLYVALHLIYVIEVLFEGVPLDSAVRRFLAYSGCLYFFFPLFFLRSQKIIKNIIIFSVMMVLIAPAYQLYTFAISSKWQMAITSSGTVRLGIGGVPILACVLFLILIFKNEIKFYPLLVLPMLSMILVGHRSVLLALIASLMIYFIIGKKITKLFLFFYVIGFLLVGVFIILESFTGHSFMDDALVRSKDTINVENQTTKARIDKILNNYNIFKSNPVFGIGYNYEKLTSIINSQTVIKTKNEDELIAEKIKDFISPHNLFLRLLSHTGIVGFTIFLLLIFAVFKKCYRKAKTREPLSYKYIFIICSITFFLIMALMNTTFIVDGWILWFLCGSTIIFNTCPKTDLE